MKLISWNVNGFRSVLKKGFLDFLHQESPDILCIQETKARAEDVPVQWDRQYHAFWNSAEKKGYSGTLVLSRIPPIHVHYGIKCPDHDREGRVIAVEFSTFFLVNVYVPNSKRDLSRLPYRQQWDSDFLQYLLELESKKPVVVCGDMNVAHEERDLTHPKANVRNHGFTQEERAGFRRFLEAGWVDSFRVFNPEGGHYTWWSPMNGARERNVGWRIDYFLLSNRLQPRLQSASILSHVHGSDHCPVGLEADL